MDVSGMKIAITGAASGIGREIAINYAKRNAVVYAIDINAEALEQLEAEAVKNGWEINSRLIDLSEMSQLVGLVEGIDDCSIWVNAAGIARNGRLIDMTAEDVSRSISVNLECLIQLTRLVAKNMATKGHGHIVNIASVAGHLPAPYMSVYTATKHAVVGFTRAFQAELELDSSPVSLTLVSPGFVDTPLIARGQDMGFPNWLKFLLATPESVADAVVSAVDKKKKEVVPTFNGKLMLGAQKVIPGGIVKSSRLLLTKSFKDWVFNRYELPGR